VVPLLADENLNNVIVRGLLRRAPGLDVVRVQDVGLGGADDPTVLAWAASHGRLLLTHDAATVPNFAGGRIEDGQRMPGVCVVTRRLSIPAAIEEILLIAECSEPADWEHKILYLPL
jgi:hypothetical protein